MLARSLLLEEIAVNVARIDGKKNVVRGDPLWENSSSSFVVDAAWISQRTRRRSEIERILCTNRLTETAPYRWRILPMMG